MNHCGNLYCKQSMGASQLVNILLAFGKKVEEKEVKEKEVKEKEELYREEKLQ